MITAWRRTPVATRMHERVHLKGLGGLWSAAPLWSTLILLAWLIPEAGCTSYQQEKRVDALEFQVQNLSEQLRDIKKQLRSLRLELKARSDSPEVITHPPEEAEAPPAADPAAGTAEKRARLLPKQWIKKVGKRRFRVQRRELKLCLEDVDALSTSIRIVPAFREGKPRGFKLYATDPGSPWDVAGLNNGDTVEQVNGTPIPTLYAATLAFGGISDRKQVTLTVRRAGRLITLRYRLVP